MLCYLAHQFPPFVASFFEICRPLRRRFREETVTDMLMSSLITAGVHGISVEFPNEPVTGADMEWNFVNSDDGTFFRILLQAKKCYGDGGQWRRHCYKELLHTTGNSATPQAVALCNTARQEAATYPLYIFYNPESTCAAARAEGVTTVTGASLADGYTIAQLVTGATNRTLRTRNKNLRTIAPLLFPLSDLFCPPTVFEAASQPFAPGRPLFPMMMGREGGRAVLGVPLPPTPAVIRDRIARSLEAMANAPGEAAAELPAVPAVATQIPEEVLDSIARAARAKDGHLPGHELRRWRVTFESASPRDMDAESARSRQGRE